MKRIMGKQRKLRSFVLGVYRRTSLELFLSPIDPALPEGKFEGALHVAMVNRIGRSIRCPTFPSGIWEKPYGMVVAAPMLPQQLQQAPRQRDVALSAALPPMNVDEHALAVDIPHLQVDPLLQAQAAGIDGAED
jgi:hypothetical protein